MFSILANVISTKFTLKTHSNITNMKTMVLLSLAALSYPLFYPAYSATLDEIKGIKKLRDAAII